MKITIIGVFPPYRGGISHFNQLLYKNLVKEHEVSIINFSRQYPSMFFPGKSQLDNNLSNYKIFNKRLLDSINPISWINVFKKLINISPNLVIYKYWMPFFAPSLGTIAFLVRNSSRIKSLCIIDNLIPHEKRLGDMVLSKYIVNNTDYFLVMSKTVEKDLLRIKPYAKYRFAEHPLYINFGESIPKQEARKKLRINEENVILYFGYIRKYKGVNYLINAIPEILKNVDLKVIIAGEFYEDNEPYLRAIKGTGKENKILLVDQFIPDDEVNIYFSAADLVVLPYIDATQSGIVRIAFNYNLPCIVTDVGGLPDMVNDGKTGYIIPPRDSGAIAKSVAKFFLSSNREKMIENVKKEKTKFSWSKFINKIQKLCFEFNE